MIKAQREKIEASPIRNPDGSPTNANPGLTIAQFGAAPIGVPNFVIDSFEIPPFLLPIYQACGTEYAIPWQVLASINRIETAFGTNLNVSSAGAMGWMQFIPSSWAAYGTDANEDGRKDPYNPVDAICAAARYLNAAGGDEDLRRAIFAYNHADWYVDEVLLYANQYAKLPDDLIGSLTGLTEGAHFPVAADARYADDISEREALKRSDTNRTTAGNAADVVSDSPTRRGINIYSSLKAPVVAVNDGVITALGENQKLGKFVVLTDAYGNRYTYAGLGEIADSHPVPKESALTAADFKLESPKGTDQPAEAPSEPATAGADQSPRPAAETGKKAAAAPVNTEELRDRLFALPERPANLSQASVSGQLDSLLGERVPAYETFKSYFDDVFKFDPKTMELRPLKVGSKVTGGTVLGQHRRLRADRHQGRPPPQLRDPARRPRRSEDRPEADPRRLEAAGDDGDLPRRRPGPVRLGRLDRPGPADVEGGARPAGARRPPHSDLLLRAHRHRVRPDRPPDPRDARVPGRARLSPHDHLAQVRPQLLYDLRQRLRPLLGQRRRHRRGQRDPDPRQPGSGVDHRGGDPRPAEATGRRCGRRRSSR